VLLGADLRVPALATKDLTGRMTLEVVPRGKHLLHRIEGGLTLHSHLRMDGSWRVLRPGTADPSRHPATRRHTVRAVLWTQDQLAVGDRLGMLDLVETVAEHRLVGHLGPDLLDRAFDRDLALSNLRRDGDRPVAEALLDQRNLAGIGTIFASEPLFEHRANPWTPVAQMEPERLGAVVDTARLWLVRSCKLGPGTGSGAPVQVPADGWLPWRPRVFGREGRPCPRCGTTIRKGTIGAQPREREVSYCPSCQGSPQDVVHN
jgi:endonuclease-8